MGTTFTLRILGFQWVFGDVGGENTSHLIDRLKVMNFHELRFEGPANNMRFTTIKGAAIDLRQLEGKVYHFKLLDG